ncbi:Pyruvate dehydrogenase E1 component subunit alpha, somatic form, mitochondrial [Homalodisca vitripennis]|nr:Pyruvate dehydrogenase E1 component subunit alpha, somatic form, mitochondrial [Homalodisca vitripennis]
MLNRPNCVKVLLRQVENQAGRFTTERAISFFGSSKKNYATEATFETKPFKLHKLESGPPTSVTISRDEAIKFYKQMQTIRRIETASGNLYKEKIIRGFCHLYSGQVM